MSGLRDGRLIIRRLVIECVELRGSLGFPGLGEPTEKQGLIDAVRAAPSVEDIFASFPLPGPEEARDVL